jgi:hypothetical protein
MNQALQKTMEQYIQPPSAGDIDLVAEVRSILNSSGLGQRVKDAYDPDRFIIEAHGKRTDVQRYLLNRYWNQQLMQAKQPSIEERFCLIPNGEIEDWLRLFKSKIMPFVIQNDLPFHI